MGWTSGNADWRKWLITSPQQPSARKRWGTFYLLLRITEPPGQVSCSVQQIPLRPLYTLRRLSYFILPKSSLHFQNKLPTHKPYSALWGNWDKTHLDLIKKQQDIRGQLCPLIKSLRGSLLNPKAGQWRAESESDKIDNQWEPTIQLREPYSMLCRDLKGKEIHKEGIYVYERLICFAEKIGTNMAL